MRMIISLSDASGDKMMKFSPDGEPLGEDSADKVMKDLKDKYDPEEQDKDDDSSTKENDRKVAGGKVSVRNYQKETKDKNTDALTDRLVDPLDGGDPNYKRKPRGSDITSAVVRTRQSHSPRTPYDT